MARVSAARVWKWVRLLGRNYASFPILLTVCAWVVASYWIVGYYIVNTIALSIYPYSFAIGTGRYPGNMTQINADRWGIYLSEVVSIEIRPTVYGDARGYAIWIPFWLVIAVFSPFAFVQWRRTLRALSIPPNHCPTCRYDLTGNTSGVCPECGGKVTAMANSELKTKPPARFREGF